MLYIQTDHSPKALRNDYQRIISLVPSQTELLHALELEERVVGITTFCIHPDEWYYNKPRVGGTKRLHFDRIAQLKPDLIIANKEENERDQIEELAKRYPVWVTDVNHLTEALRMIKDIGVITNREEAARGMAENIENGFASLRIDKPGKVIYFIWKSPYMVAGKNTFIDDMLSRCGWKNAVDTSRYPVMGAEDLKQLRPDVVLLSSEPYPFKEKHLEEFKQIFPKADVLLADGEIFSWYGSRLLQAPFYFRGLIQKISV